MKRVILTLILAVAFITAHASEKEIIATVVFENITGKKFSSGVFYITETNVRIEVNNLENFRITLPKKGKYQFGFSTDDFIAYTFYPSRINNKRNTITIRLVEKNVLPVDNFAFSFPFKQDINLTDEQIEQKVSDGSLNFIGHGINNSIPKEYVYFKKKYGIGLIIENCVIDPFSFKKTTENNQMIADYLNNKYGLDWINELSTLPFGIN